MIHDVWWSWYQLWPRQWAGTSRAKINCDNGLSPSPHHSLRFFTDRHQVQWSWWRDPSFENNPTTSKTINDFRDSPTYPKTYFTFWWSSHHLSTTLSLSKHVVALERIFLSLFQVWFLGSWVSCCNKYIKTFFNQKFVPISVKTLSNHNCVPCFRAGTFLLISTFLFVAAILASILKQCDHHRKREWH